MKYISVAYILLLFASACKKDPAIAPVVSAGTPYSWHCEDTTFDRTPIQNDPFGLIYHYQNSPGKLAAWRVLYDPIDENVIYYMTTEAHSQPHTLWRYNRQSKEKKLLDENVLNTMNISKNGWLAYDKNDWNIYIVKTNGDSLTQLTTGGSFFYPSWSDDGQHIYYYNDSQPPGEDRIFRTNKKGTLTDTVRNIEQSAYVFQIQNNLYYTTFDNSIGKVLQKDLSTGHSKTIESGDGTDNFYTDQNQNFLYYSNDEGLYQVNMQTLQKKKIINSGIGSNCKLIYFRRSSINGNFIAVELQDSLLNVNTIRSTSYIVEFSSDGKCRHRVEVPD